MVKKSDALPTVSISHVLVRRSFKLNFVSSVRTIGNFMSLPPASEGRGRYMFSVCSHLGGGGIQPGQEVGVLASQVRTGGTTVQR